MNNEIHKKLDLYAKRKFNIEPEVLPFSQENYEIYRHPDTGKWFAVFIQKERSAFGLEGVGHVEIICVKPKEKFTIELLSQQSGYLRDYPSKNWNWLSVVLDGTVSFDEICQLLDESYKATTTKTKNKNVSLPKKND